MRRSLISIGFLAAIAVPFGFPGAAPALASGAAGPTRWAIASVSEPTHFASSVSEIQNVTVKATGGSFTLTVGRRIDGVPVIKTTGAIACDASAASVQAELEGLETVGTGDVSVTGGAATCSEANTTPYVVAFRGRLRATQLETQAGSGSLTGTAPGVVVTASATAGVDQYYRVTATNVGGEPTSGSVTITDALPSGAEAVEAEGARRGTGTALGESFTGGSLACETVTDSDVQCGYAGVVAPGDTLTFRIRVDVTGSSLLTANEVAVFGGGAIEDRGSGASAVIDSPAAPFGLENLFSATSTGQAGAHPDFTTSFALNQDQSNVPVDSPRDIEVALPPGLLGNPLATPRCTIYLVRHNLCPEEDAVGVATVIIGSTSDPGGAGNFYVPLVYNITPYPGEPAAFAFTVATGEATARLDTSVIPNSDGEYIAHVSIPDINQAELIESSSVTLWGVPDDYNGPGPDSAAGATGVFFGGRRAGGTARPFMRAPTSCASQPARTVGLELDSWEEPGFLAESVPFATPFECAALSPLFTPSLDVNPETKQAGAPTGYDVSLHVSQNENPEGSATPDLRDTTIALPVGVVASSSVANGLQACSDAQFNQSSTGPATCPQQSQIGTVRVKTPLVEEELTGQAFLGEPECSPCGTSEAAEGKLVRLFLQIQYESGEYVRVKLTGHTRIDQETGRLTTIFENDPQLPFEVLSVELKGGEDAPLANPSTCGSATTTSQLAPWSSAPEEPDAAEPSSSFTVDGCSASRFGPSFSAGMTGSGQAGGYSPFSVTFSRTDQDQDLGGITVNTPPGLLGMVSHAALCREAQANAGTCGPESQIGEATVAVGPGSEPFWVKGGRVYLTGPYGGDPFGLSVVVPAEAGPFKLAGDTGSGTEVVRAKIAINPSTAALTVSSGQLPTELDGIPLKIKTVDVSINRPEFMFNATNCEALGVAGTIVSSQSASVGVSSPYQAANCASLPFDPSFTVSTQGKTSKADGASLDVKVAQRPGEANIHKVDLQLPLILPARLTTLQKACTEAQFNANPAGCPEASNIGTAIAHTPVLDVPLTGPAYLVSHGGAAFPDVEFVLQADERGSDVEIVLDGGTDIKKGITYSRFETVPDAPISSFETVLPEGPHSALAANAGLCGQSLVMPTTIVGQNGAQVEQSTQITVTGCPKPSVKIAKVKVKADALLITVTTSTEGSVTIAGKGLKTLEKTLEAGSHQVKLALTKAGKSLRVGHRRDKLRATLKSTAASAVTGTKTLRL
jgi:hypothetical protein